ncbi:MAG: hypothetical protein ACNS62_00330 [Candidatus Cyclobacteriaceae bacterium M3_2C_046]
MLRFVIILLICGLFSTSKAQTTPDTIRLSGHSIGAAAGFSTGVGLSYRYWPVKHGFQVTFLPVIGEDDTFVSLGTTWLIKLKDGKNVDLFLFAANHFYWQDDWDSNQAELSMNLGFGPGFEFTISQVVGINLMFGYGLYDYIDNIQSNFTGEFGIFYKL